jgi:hypothetical protein
VASPIEELRRREAAARHEVDELLALGLPLGVAAGRWAWDLAPHTALIGTVRTSVAMCYTPVPLMGMVRECGPYRSAQVNV